jgi:hypothetical protein
MLAGMHTRAVSNDRISDQDAERIANAIGRKLLRYGLIALLLLVVLPLVCMYAYRSTGG